MRFMADLSSDSGGTNKTSNKRTRCVLTMNHDTDRAPHDAGRDVHCRFEDHLGNKVFVCKKCSMSGRRNVVVPKTSESSANTLLGFTSYLVSGYVMECATCGVIYRSRQHWYGNPDPESVVIVEVQHIWPQGNRSLQGTHNAARKLVDSFSFVADTISSVSARPAKMFTECIADQFAPSYWVPNSQITSCRGCDLVFSTNEQKHHCRACGHGFCDECSSKKRLVPERGWKDEPVRVCDACYAGNGAESEFGDRETTLTARKVGEAVSSTLGVLASALDYPKNDGCDSPVVSTSDFHLEALARIMAAPDVLKDSARPAYWVPDDQIEACIICKQEFNAKRPIHHCRACGEGVCDDCSQGRRQVPLRGWDYPVRVCTKCENKTENF